MLSFPLPLPVTGAPPPPGMRGRYSLPHDRQPEPNHGAGERRCVQECPDVRAGERRCAQMRAGERRTHCPHCGAARLAVTSCPRPASRSDVTGGGGRDVSQQKRRLREGFMAACSSLTVGDSQPCSHSTSDRMRENGLTGGSGWTSGRNSSPKGLSSIQAGCRAAVESPALVAFKRPVDVAPGDRVQWWAWQCEVYTWTSPP